MKIGGGGGFPGLKPLKLLQYFDANTNKNAPACITRILKCQDYILILYNVHDTLTYLYLFFILTKQILLIDWSICFRELLRSKSCICQYLLTSWCISTLTRSWYVAKGCFCLSISGTQGPVALTVGVVLGPVLNLSKSVQIYTLC